MLFPFVTFFLLTHHTGSVVGRRSVVDRSSFVVPQSVVGRSTVLRPCSLRSVAPLSLLPPSSLLSPRSLSPPSLLPPSSLLPFNRRLIRNLVCVFVRPNCYSMHYQYVSLLSNPSDSACLPVMEPSEFCSITLHL